MTLSYMSSGLQLPVGQRFVCCFCLEAGRVNRHLLESTLVRQTVTLGPSSCIKRFSISGHCTDW